jgi:hypothetical protein
LDLSIGLVVEVKDEVKVEAERGFLMVEVEFFNHVAEVEVLMVQHIFDDQTD